MIKKTSFDKKHRVVEEITQRIRSGKWASGKRLPGEHQLAAEFDISRGTLREALAELKRRNYIATQGGVGSFVTFDGVPLDSQRGWARALEHSGARVQVELLGLSHHEDPELAASFECRGFIQVLRRRRIDSGIYVSLERSLLPVWEGLEDLPERGLVNGSITDTLSALGLKAAGGEQWLGLHALTAGESEWLERPAATRFLRSTRLSRDTDGRCLEQVISLLDPDHFHLHLAF